METVVGGGRDVGGSTDAEESIRLAETLTGAVPERWVNVAVAGEDYMDFVRERRR